MSNNTARDKIRNNYTHKKLDIDTNQY